MTSDQTKSSRMLIGRDRLYYWGLLGRSMKSRRMGSYTIYALPEGTFDIAIADGAFTSQRIAIVPPFVPHRLHSECGRINTIALEPESLSEREILRLVQDCRSANPEVLASIQASVTALARIGCSAGFSTEDFDRLILGRSLMGRRMDPRIGHILTLMSSESHEQGLAAEDCARAAGVSTSRFLHLFKECTDYSFRAQRMWKRARRFMDHAGAETSLTDVALELGYPDSSHFSHSIRGTYGLQPRAIRQGSRGIQISFGDGYAVSALCA